MKIIFELLPKITTTKVKTLLILCIKINKAKIYNEGFTLME
jgi:hypothetical protein